MIKIKKKKLYIPQMEIFKMQYSTKWIEENLDFNTILNNFIYIFGISIII